MGANVSTAFTSNFNFTFTDTNHCTEDLDLQVLLHHSFKPEYGYYLQTKPNMTWQEFTGLMGEQAQDWAKCSQCARTWDVVSTMSDYKGHPVIFRDNLLVYPEYAARAIEAFKAKFRSTEYTDKILFTPPDNCIHDGMNFGRERSGGHVHLFLESNLDMVQDEEEEEAAFTRQRIITVGLQQLESSYKNHKDKWTPEFFKRASESNYGVFTDCIASFCQRMQNYMIQVRTFPRMLRPFLIQEINTFCSTFCDKFQGEALLRVVQQVIKVFRRRAGIKYSDRETIFRNFILNCKADKKTFRWPEKSTYAERIVAIGLHNALYTDRDANIVCLMMNVPFNHEDPHQTRRHALGCALRAYLQGDPIHLGVNRHRQQILFYNLTGSWPSMPGLSTVESCSLLFIDNSSLELAGEVLAGFLGVELGKSQVETFYNALLEFTSCPPKIPPKQKTK